MSLELKDLLEKVFRSRLAPAPLKLINGEQDFDFVIWFSGADWLRPH